jgi:hypothetical protein
MDVQESVARAYFMEPKTLFGAAAGEAAAAYKH